VVGLHPQNLTENLFLKSLACRPKILSVSFGMAFLLDFEIDFSLDFERSDPKLLKLSEQREQSDACISFAES
jgi:hypothetical protein